MLNVVGVGKRLAGIVGKGVQDPVSCAVGDWVTSSLDAIQGLAFMTYAIVIIR